MGAAVFSSHQHLSSALVCLDSPASYVNQVIIKIIKIIMIIIITTTTGYSVARFLYEILLKALYSVLLPPVTGFSINFALIVLHLKSLGSMLARRHFRGTHMPNQATNNFRILQDTFLYIWVKSSNVDKVSCWRYKKCHRQWRESNCGHKDRSQSSTSI